MSPNIGRTRWIRFVLVLFSGLTATGLLAVGMAEDALAASYLVSDQRFKLSSDLLIGHGVAQYGVVDVAWNGDRIPVGVRSFRHAIIRNLCQSFLVPLGPLGTYTAKITAGQGARPVTAENLVTDAVASYAADTRYRRFDSGIAAGAITKGRVDPGDAHSSNFDPGSIGQQAVMSVDRNSRVIAVATSAEDIDLPGLTFTIKRNGPECF